MLEKVPKALDAKGMKYKIINENTIYINDMDAHIHFDGSDIVLCGKTTMVNEVYTDFGVYGVMYKAGFRDFPPSKSKALLRRAERWIWMFVEPYVKEVSKHGGAALFEMEQEIADLHKDFEKIVTQYNIDSAPVKLFDYKAGILYEKAKQIAEGKTTYKDWIRSSYENMSREELLDVVVKLIAEEDE